MLNKYLPLGSIIKILDSNTKVMIIGYKAKSKQGDQIYDYFGCQYPQGYQNDNRFVLFNHSMISEVFFTGDTEDKEYIELNKKLNSMEVSNG